MNFKQIRIWLVKILVYLTIIFAFAVFGILFLEWRIRMNSKRDPRFTCASWFKQIGLSLKQYAMDYENFFPPEDNAQGLDKLRELGYLTEYRVFTCPGADMEPGTKGPLTEASCGYIYLGGFKDDESGDVPLAFDKPGNHPDYVNVIFVDGHIKGYPTSASGSCEKIIVFLNKEHKYPPELFKKLLDKAKKIDSALPEK